MSDDTPTTRLAALASTSRFAKFASAGVVGAVCDVLLLVALVEVVGLRAEVANVLSIEAAILVIFAVNETWTFAAETDGRGLGPRLLKSHAVRAGGAALQYGVFVLLINLVAVSFVVRGVELWLVAAKVASIGLAMVVNYTFESLFTWQVHRGGAG